MPGLIPSTNTCCDPCVEPLSVAVPGPAGATGAAGTNGTNGINAFSTGNTFVMPAELANVTVTVTSSQWMGVGQVIFASGGGFVGYFDVQSKPTTTSVILRNLENAAANAYQINAAAGSVFPNLTTLSPGGIQGPAAAGPGIYSGVGSPETVVTAVVGSIYTDIAAATRYSKLSGSGNTGWG